MVKNYKVITLCGSTRFKDEFLKVQKRTNPKRKHRNFGRIIWSFW